MRQLRHGTHILRMLKEPPRAVTAPLRIRPYRVSTAPLRKGYVPVGIEALWSAETPLRPRALEQIAGDSGPVQSPPAGRPGKGEALRVITA